MGKSPDVPTLSATTVVPWVLRAAWVLVPFTLGPALGGALAGRTGAVDAVATVMAWTGWTAVLVALLVPRGSSLTVVRVGVPGALVLAAWAVGLGGADVGGPAGVAALVVTAVATALALAPATSDAFVTGSAYGAERRFALRCPPTLAVLAVVTWVAVAAGAVAGPLLLAAERWLAGAVVLVVGAAVVVLGGRSLHQLARRWVVFVPSGLVVHDPVARPDSVMAPRPLIESLGPAPDHDDVVDLTLGASGLGLVLVTSEPLPVTVRHGRDQLGTEPATRVVFTPSRPGAVLAEAGSRRIPVG